MKHALILLIAVLSASQARAAPFVPVAIVQSHDVTDSEQSTLIAKGWLDDYRATRDALSSGMGYAQRGSLQTLIARLDTLVKQPPGILQPPATGRWILAGHSVELVKTDAPEITPRAEMPQGPPKISAPVGNLLVAADRFTWLPVDVLRAALSAAIERLAPETADTVQAQMILADALGRVRSELRYRDPALLSAYRTLESAIQHAPVESGSLRTRLRDAAVALNHEPQLKELARDLESLAQQTTPADYALVNTAAKVRQTIEARARAALPSKK
jgi:hypothetical protein